MTELFTARASICGGSHELGLPWPIPPDVRKIIGRDAGIFERFARSVTITSVSSAQLSSPRDRSRRQYRRKLAGKARAAFSAPSAGFSTETVPKTRRARLYLNQLLDWSPYRRIHRLGQARLVWLSTGQHYTGRLPANAPFRSTR